MKRIYVVVIMSILCLGCAASRRTAKLDQILSEIRTLVKVDESLDQHKDTLPPEHYKMMKKEVKANIEFLQKQFEKAE